MKRMFRESGSAMDRLAVVGGLLRAALPVLLAACLVVPPLPGSLGWVAVAVADDDDDDGGGAATGGGASFGASSAREQDRPQLRKKSPRKTVRKAAPARAPARPVIVVLDLPQAAQEQARLRGFAVLDDDTLEAVGIRVQRLRLPRNMSVATARRIMAELGASESDVNATYRPQQEEACDGGSCSPLDLIGWPGVAASTCSAAPTIGIVETSVDTKDPTLVGRNIEVIDLRPRRSRASSPEHGTAVTSLIAGNPFSAVPGLLPEAAVIVAVPYYRSSRGVDVTQVHDVVRAIDALLQRKPDVLNLSLSGPPNAVLERVVAAAVERGVPVVVAAGNAGAGSKPLYPAAYDQATAVTAVSSTLKIYRRAPRGEHIDFAAPGVQVKVAVGGGRTAMRSGTSFAAPYVAAALALRKRTVPDATVAELVAWLAKTARDLGEVGRDRTFGWGLLQVNDICGTGDRSSADIP